MSLQRAGSLALVAAALLLPRGGAAAEPVFGAPVFDLGLRLAFAPAVGSAAAHVPMAEAIAWQAPVQLDATGRIAPRVSVGGYASWALAGVGAQACTDGASCSARVVRAGAQAVWTFEPWSFGAEPWVGVAAGWEWGSERRERLGATTTTGWSGPEAGLQAGAGWRLGERFTLGPFALVAVGAYGRQSVETPEASASAAISERAGHVWIQLGVRGVLGL